jgi:CRP-like cAMP-binding protein
VRIENLLLGSLPGPESRRLLALGELVPLTLAEVLCVGGEPQRHVHFPESGFLSLVHEIPGHPGMEVGMIGREGVLGAHLALGVAAAPLRALVQGPGMAWRIEAAAFIRELGRSPVLRQRVDRYLYVLMAQLATAAACQRFHPIGRRLARWLLMSQDRARSDRFHVTHEFLGYMLGVRRVGVTVAASDLQRRGLIEYHRGELTVCDRRRLKAAACSCYAENERVYAAWLAPAVAATVSRASRSAAPLRR